MMMTHGAPRARWRWWRVGVVGLTIAIAASASADPDPTPETLASDQARARDLVLGRKRLYWRTSAGVYSVSKAGGNVVEHRRGQVVQLALRGDRLVWVEADGTIRQLAPGRTTPVTLASGHPSAEWLAADGSGIYWCEMEAGGDRLMRLTPTGAVEQVSLSRHEIGDLAVGPTHLYWTTIGGELMRAIKTGGRAEVMVEGIGGAACSLVLDGSWIFWTICGDGGVRKVRRRGGKAVTLQENEGGEAIAAADFEPYWVYSDANQIRTARRAAGGVRTIISRNVMIGDIAVDDRFVYWIETPLPPDGGAMPASTIMRTSRRSR